MHTSFNVHLSMYTHSERERLRQRHREREIWLEDLTFLMFLNLQCFDDLDNDIQRIAKLKTHHWAKKGSLFTDCSHSTEWTNLTFNVLTQTASLKHLTAPWLCDWAMGSESLHKCSSCPWTLWMSTTQLHNWIIPSTCVRSTLPLFYC